MYRKPLQIKYLSVFQRNLLPPSSEFPTFYHEERSSRCLWNASIYLPDSKTPKKIVIFAVTAVRTSKLMTREDGHK
jgi:hypothetical protein